ncbi:MAG: hypothetical protein ACXVBW_03600, partial [Bdellovibrionota bacterium]
MKLKRAAVVLSVAAVLGVAEISGHAQSTQSNYVFRFNTGVSGVFLSDMTFQSQQPLNLGACTVTEKVNGPLSCAVNCENQAVCLMELSGPPNSSVNDVLQKVSETPVGAPSSVPASGPAVYGTFNDVNRRIKAYNEV